MNPALVALLAGATFIALSPIFVREALAAGVGPTAAAFWRVALAVPVLWIVYRLKHGPHARRYEAAVIPASGPCSWPPRLPSPATSPSGTSRSS